jgi:hypothetical protein
VLLIHRPILTTILSLSFLPADMEIPLYNRLEQTNKRAGLGWSGCWGYCLAGGEQAPVEQTGSDDEKGENCVFFYDVVRQLGVRIAREVSMHWIHPAEAKAPSITHPSPLFILQHALNEHGDTEFNSNIHSSHDLSQKWSRQSNKRIKKSAQKELKYSVKHYYAAIAIYAAFRNNRFCSNLQLKMEEEMKKEAEKKGK